MASARQFEIDLEDIFIAELATNAEVVAQSWAVRNWSDASSAKVQKAIVVHCSPVSNIGVDMTRQGELYEAIMEIGGMVHAPADKNRAIVNNMLGAIRDTLKSSSLETDLSTVKYLIKNVMVGSGGSDAEQNNYIQSSVTVTVQFQYVP